MRSMNLVLRVDTRKKKLMKRFSVKVSMVREHQIHLDSILITAYNSSIRMEATLTARSDQQPHYNTKTAGEFSGLQVQLQEFNFTRVTILSNVSVKKVLFINKELGFVSKLKIIQVLFQPMQIISQNLPRVNASS